MALLGKTNSLRVLRLTDIGAFLDGENLGDILLPQKYVPVSCVVDKNIDVFLYTDSEDRVIATTLRPDAQVGQFAYLRATSVNHIGAFLEWGLPKDLLVPFREQNKPMQAGRSYVVYIYHDERSNRLAASAKIDKFLSTKRAELVTDEAVDLIVCHKTDLGVMCIVNNSHWGMLFHNEIFQRISYGQSLKGFVKRVRTDGKIDVTLQKSGLERVNSSVETVLAKLNEYNGVLPLSDKSPPEKIYALLGMSKKTFKEAIGKLYKRSIVSLDKDAVRRIDKKTN